MSRSSSMQRPVMDPLFLQDLQAAPPSRWKQWLGRVARWTGWFARKLFSSPALFQRRRLRFAQESRSSRLFRGAAYRLLFAPVVLATIACLFVYTATHPRQASAGGDPTSFGVFYETVTLNADDGVRLSGWLVPVVDARRVMLHKDRLLHQKHPAVVLIHDQGQSPLQMLPLVAPLHEDGAVVLAIGLRGSGGANAAPQTFGLTEANDVRAAINFLRGRPFIDDTRIAVVGLGTGANAALLAAEKDPALAAVILAEPAISADDVSSHRLGPTVFGLRWMQPLTKWAFEIGFRQDLDEVGLGRHTSTLTSPKTLRLDSATQESRLMAAATEQIRAFCRTKLRPWE